MVELTFLSLALLIQVSAAAIAFYLVRYSGRYRYPWLGFSVALFLMAEALIESLYETVVRASPSLSLTAIFALAVAILMLASVLAGRRVVVELQRQELELQRLAVIDELTNLPNHSEIIRQALRETERHLRLRRPLALLMVDLDSFRSINETHGHTRGDEVLKEVAAACRLSLRKIDLFGRTGGGEFLALLPESSLADARAIAERLRDSVAKRPLIDAPPVTITIGVTELDHAQAPAAFALTAMMARADKALFAAKAVGRGQIEVITL